MKNNKYVVPYKIATSRTVMRCWDPRDARIMQEAINVSIDSLLPWMPWARSEPRDFSTKTAVLQKFQDNFDLGIDFVYGIFTRDETDVIGSYGLEPVEDNTMEIGCWINRTFQGFGYSTETTKAIIKSAFDVAKVDKVRISFHRENKSSLRVAEKAGFDIQGTLANMNRSPAKSADIIIITLSKDDYLQSDVRNEVLVFYDSSGHEMKTF